MKQIWNQESEEIDLLELARTLWKRAWIILFATVAAGTVVYLYSVFLATPMYTAQTLLYVTNRSDSASNISSSDLTAAQSLVDTYGVILTARSTMEEVLETSGSSYSVEELQDMVSSGAVDSTEVLSVKVTNADPAEAAEIANAIAKVLPQKISEHIKGCSVSVVDYAAVPEKQSSPNALKNTLIGCLFGFFLACTYIVILFLMDTKIHDEEYLMQTYELPILAAVPDLSRKSSTSGYYAAPAKLKVGGRVTQR